MLYLHQPLQLALVLSAHTVRMVYVMEMEDDPIMSVHITGEETSTKVRHTESVGTNDFLNLDTV